MYVRWNSYWLVWEHHNQEISSEQTVGTLWTDTRNTTDTRDMGEGH